MTQPLRCDVDLVQRSTRQVITHPDALTGGSLTSRSPDGFRQLRIAQDVERLFERLEVVGADQHERGSPVTGDQDPVMILLDRSASSER